MSHWLAIISQDNEEFIGYVILRSDGSSLIFRPDGVSQFIRP